MIARFLNNWIRSWTLPRSPTPERAERVAMGRAKRAHSLAVCMNGERVGHWSLAARGAPECSYREAILRRAQARFQAAGSGTFDLLTALRRDCAGAQEKTALPWPNDQWCLPLHGSG